MPDNNQKIVIVTAVIGLVGTLGAAIINNWHKQVATPQPTAVLANTPPTPETPDLTGSWHDRSYPNNGAKIIQTGKRFTYSRWGTLPNGTRYTSSGNGSIDDFNINLRYQARYSPTEILSTGDCQGSLTPDGGEMQLSCKDSLLGEFGGFSIRD